MASDMVGLEGTQMGVGRGAKRIFCALTIRLARYAVYALLPAPAALLPCSSAATGLHSIQGTRGAIGRREMRGEQRSCSLDSAAGVQVRSRHPLLVLGPPGPGRPEARASQARLDILLEL